MLRRYGDSALLLDWESRIDLDINASVHHYAAALGQLPGVSECVPAYASLLVTFSPALTSFDTLAEQVYALRMDGAAIRQPTLHTLPVCYGGDYGPDLAGVSQLLALEEAEVIRRHTAVTYRVYFLGFRPGFAFLGDVDERLSVPRLASPRARVPAGSVGIAGRQTGVYPTPSPGGWQLLGRCPLPLLSEGPEVMHLRPGDRVRFVSVSADECDRSQPATEWTAG